MPVELAMPLKPEDVKMERSHFVKFVMKEGKHMKVWECGICKFSFSYLKFIHQSSSVDKRFLKKTAKLHSQIYYFYFIK